jgi:glutathione S-transferase
MKIYGDLQSGNCYKVKLLLALLGLPHEWVHVDTMKGETRTPQFLAMNPNGRIPLLELDDGTHLPESNAIMNYLAEGSRFIPAGRLERARMLQWMFFEQYSHEPFVAVARYIIRYLGRPPERAADLQSKMAPGYRALGVMEAHLARHDWFAGGACSIADIALYAYTHVAHEGDFDLSAYPAVGAWLARVRAEPGYLPMPAR